MTLIQDVAARSPPRKSTLSDSFNQFLHSKLFLITGIARRRNFKSEDFAVLLLLVQILLPTPRKSLICPARSWGCVEQLTMNRFASYANLMQVRRGPRVC